MTGKEIAEKLSMARSTVAGWLGRLASLADSIVRMIATLARTGRTLETILKEVESKESVVIPLVCLIRKGLADVEAGTSCCRRASRPSLPV
jgi:transcriptional regulator with XRE-family HTH domain